MVLDAKAMTWAAQNDLDTAKLKAAKVPIYGKWYFPELPLGVPLINLQSGDRETFTSQAVAGELMWVRERDLRRAKLGPFKDVTDEELAADQDHEAGIAVRREPLLAMYRSPEGLKVAPKIAPPHTALALMRSASALVQEPDRAALGSIHMPRPSIAPFIFGMGLCLSFLGLAVLWQFLVVGLIWMLVGAIAWVRVGRMDGHAPEDGGAH